MGAETLVELYRTQECRKTFKFKSVVTITYFGTSAMLQGMIGTFSKACWYELQEYLISKEITLVQYFRKGTLVTLSQAKQRRKTKSICDGSTKSV